MIKNYDKHANIFRKILTDIPPDGIIRSDDILDHPSTLDVQIDTKKKYLKKFIENNPQYLSKIIGFYPTSSTIVSLVEQNRQERVVQENLYESNKEAKRIVDGITIPLVGNFIQDALGSYVVKSELKIPLQKIIDFLQTDYFEFNAQSGNGLRTIAGSVSEQLLDRLLTNHGMVAKKDYKKTGRNSKADFIVYSSNKKQLSIEVKSYHARERLLRGLQDITGEKVGFGYFTDPREFNAHRTITLIQSGAAAIYLPKHTLNMIESSARDQITTRPISMNSKFYRPFEQFATGMLYFSKNGKTPKYI